MQIHQKQVEQVMLPKKRCATGIRIWTKWTAVFFYWSSLHFPAIGTILLFLNNAYKHACVGYVASISPAIIITIIIIMKIIIKSGNGWSDSKQRCVFESCIALLMRFIVKFAAMEFALNRLCISIFNRSISTMP